MRAERPAALPSGGSLSNHCRRGPAVLAGWRDRAFDEAQRSLAGYELSEGDVSDAKYYAEIYEGAQKMITENSYNSAVTDFTRSVYNTFPTDILAELAGVDEPQRFS